MFFVRPGTASNLVGFLLSLDNSRQCSIDLVQARLDELHDQKAIRLKPDGSNKGIGGSKGVDHDEAVLGKRDRQFLRVLSKRLVQCRYFHARIDAGLANAISVSHVVRPKFVPVRGFMRLQER